MRIFQLLVCAVYGERVGGTMVACSGTWQSLDPSSFTFLPFAEFQERKPCY